MLPLVSEKSSLEFWYEYAEIHSLNRGAQRIRNVGPTNDNGADGKVAHRSRLGGLLNFYYREAARASAMDFRTGRHSEDY